MFIAQVRDLWSHNNRQSLAMIMAASMTSILLLALVTLLLFILLRGSAFFWPTQVKTIEYQIDSHDQIHTVLAKVQQIEGQSSSALTQGKHLAETHLEVSTIDSLGIQSHSIILNSENIIKQHVESRVAEMQMDDGQYFFFYLDALQSPSKTFLSVDGLPELLQQVSDLEKQISLIRDGHLSSIHRQIAQLDRSGVALDAPARVKLEQQFFHFQQAINRLQQSLSQYLLFVSDAEGNKTSIMLSDVSQVHFPNQLTTLGKLGLSVTKIFAFLLESPKQANTAGGIFPALFGTILMVLLMTVIVTPFGVLAAIYLSEYAPANALTSAVRIGVSNMAGVPSIVYGVFGLGFFVYGIGGGIDELFYSDHLPSPTFGTPGLFWASLTMALLTLPVVVVATEEGLKRVPRGIRNSSYALGATKIETIWYTVLPIASPGIMTGVILAIARAAGEVAPLMLVGAVKFAPTLPVDSDFPFLHLDRQFMHLGVLIYDGAFHSQTSIQGSSMMFAACLLLLLCVFGLNLIAINLRSRLRKRYSQD
ncbi:phosphate ABC transporter permease PstA [Alteromonas facilis]|uniref:phosphate ABC transporter permease PstA n=1 Tax=Alteromonas facilis TaxID=2048004 RepID=UPI000C288205|nr:phosphate ABC transporter permease PstA [Alteromonas facilis]